MEYVGWLLGVNRSPVSEELRKDAPNMFVAKGDLKRCDDTFYEHSGDGGSTTYVADLPFFVNGLVDACGVVLPYFELKCVLASKGSSELWVGEYKKNFFLFFPRVHHQTFTLRILECWWC